MLPYEVEFVMILGLQTVFFWTSTLLQDLPRLLQDLPRLLQDLLRLLQDLLGLLRGQVI